MSTVTRSLVAISTSAFGGHLIRLWIRTGVKAAVGGSLEGVGSALWEPLVHCIKSTWEGVYYFLCVLVIFELRSEIWSLVSIVWRVFRCLIQVTDRKAQFLDTPEIEEEPSTGIETEHLWLTCQHLYMEGFFLSERSGEWDEIWVAGLVPDSGELIARSTNEDGSDWIWSLIRCEAGSLRPPVGAGAQRAAPPGIAPATVNWICSPEHVDQRWAPTVAEAAALKQEAAVLGLHVKRIGVQDGQVTIPGRGMSLIPFTAAPIAGGASAAAPRGAVGALGPVPAPEADGGAFNLQSLSDVIQELKDMARKKEGQSKEKSKKKKRSRKKSKDKKKKKKRKDSSSGSSTSRSRSSASSRSSSQSSSGPLLWKPKGKDREVSYKKVHAVDSEKFKRKGELLAYASRHPGALSGHFLASIYARLSKGKVERSSQLREASVVSWAAQHSGLTEVRDVREVLTLAEAMDAVNRKEIARAMDILAQRILAIQQAKRKGGSWEKARGHTWVNSSYPDLVRKNVKAGLHVLKKEKQVAKHRGSLCLAGAFAVPKDETEAETKAAFCGPTWLSRAEQVYGWLDDLRGRKVRVTTLPDVIWCELMTAALLLPYAQFNLSAPFSQRVECSDASMSGIGRAWATMPSDLVQRMAQLCDHPGTYTNLNLPFGLALNEEDKCPLRKLKLPRNLFHWHTAGARWRPLYIFLGEADAAVWVAECRLRRACDDEHRFVHPLDSASCVGAFMKGRSSSRLLNHRCQKLCAIGTRRDDDLVSWVERLSQEHGLHIYGLRVDPLSPMSQRDLGFTCNDLLDGHSMLHILQLVQSGRVAGLFVSPPCSTFSAVRHKPLHRQSGAQVGPRPLRARSNPWSCLPNRTSRENHSVDIGTALAFICIGMLGEARIFGAWVGGEHPADRGCEPYPSIFCSTEIQQLCSIVRLCIYVIDQCMFGAKTRKPTGLVLPYGNDEFVRTCNHTQGHTQLFGWDSAGQCFRTTAATAYPSGLSQALASLFVTRILASKSHGYEQPYAPMQVHSDSFGRDPWFSQQRTAWTWPAPSRSFLAEVIARCHQRKIPTSNSAPQS
ncbi:unnamed protein product [Durusdinium trenchii]|uniref:Uncharacterized protein n=1 Tax=Durusdinium trenchii TaxID=1381693 RepID=A0ABP0KYE5_9DINO